ncbi:hypothetical protein FTV88_2711 [Heliorestis convoluta]|uniref:Uncharacterized protein n=1 Tax=Heliorestis convoluta TaxID=356322 RepID=A0A5Q2N956_9FIRM|nr:hypothetical protein FTV88_2711 [Heliorestis convoluta]
MRKSLLINVHPLIIFQDKTKKRVFTRFIERKKVTEQYVPVLMIAFHV